MDVQREEIRIQEPEPGCIRQSGVGLAQAAPPALVSEKLQLVGSLAGSLAHDFSNPLCGVRNVLERLTRKSDLSDTEQHLLLLSLQQCDRMKLLIQDLQDFIHASTTGCTCFDLVPAMAVVLRLMHKQLKLSQLVVHPLDEPELLMVVGCENQIKQMLLHLFAAACRGMAASRCQISLNALRDGGWLRLVWQFQVPEEAANRLDRFFVALTQPDPILDSGPAMAHSILKSHGGTMVLTEVAQGGGELVLSLPTGK